MKANLVALFTLNNYFNFSSPKKKKKNTLNKGKHKYPGATPKPKPFREH